MEILKQSVPQPEVVPAVSVIITAYNAAPYINQAVDSVLAQTFTDYEIIVVNDGSPDTSDLEKALEPYRERIVYIKQENRGTGAARNVGIRAARAQLISLLDGDDLWEPDYLALQMNLLEKKPRSAVVYSNALHFGDGETAGRTFMEICPSDGEVTLESLLNEQCNVMVSVTARRESIIAAGMFDEDRSVMGSDDFDLWLRIIKQGDRITYQRRALVHRRLWNGQLSSRQIPFYESILRVLDKVEQNMQLTPAQRLILKRRQTHNRAMLNLIKGKEAFFRGDAKAAMHYLTKANSFLNRPKVSLAILFLRIAPCLLFSQSIRRHLISKVLDKPRDYKFARPSALTPGAR